jgi:hypothetical protein
MIIHYYVSLFKEFDDKFEIFDKFCWVVLFKIECIIFSSILNAILQVNPISKSFIFIQFDDIFIIQVQ